MSDQSRTTMTPYRPAEEIAADMLRRQTTDPREERLRAQLLLIRVILGLNPVHDPVEAVRVLHDEGREAFEKLRGARCAYASRWRPS